MNCESAFWSYLKQEGELRQASHPWCPQHVSQKLSFLAICQPRTHLCVTNTFLQLHDNINRIHVYFQNRYATAGNSWHRYTTLTSLDATSFPRSSPFSLTFLSAPGRTFQNSSTNSVPLRLLFCKMSLARWRKGTFCSLLELWNCLSQVWTICSAFFLW